MSVRKVGASLCLVFCGVAAACLVPAGAHASGFVLYDQSAGALAQGSAVVASTHEPAANWFNPAALAFQNGAAVSGTAALAYAGVRFTPDTGSTVKGSSGAQVVPNVFATTPLHGRWHMGLGLLAPYGYAVRWPQAWQGREKAIAVDVAVLALNLNVAARLSDRWSLAVGVAPLYGRVNFVVGLPSEAASRGDLQGSAWNWQANAGALWRAIPGRWHWGATYRGLNQNGRSRLHLRGPAKFEAMSATLAETFIDQEGKASLPLPDMASIGTAWWARPDLRFGLQLDYTRWSVFERLEVQFERPTTPRVIIDRRSRDAASLRAGMEYSGWRPGWQVRAGLTYEQTTGRPESLAPSAPDGPRIAAAMGVGVAWRRTQIDVGYSFLYFLPAKATTGLEGPAGTYDTRAHILSMTVAPALGKR
ncbi:MAG: outer membrane protein transport protein [Deltaproteobacteria bacterium]|nr:outer membrane protein transport protein [Deltaproteobacteria bacterium]